MSHDQPYVCKKKHVTFTWCDPCIHIGKHEFDRINENTCVSHVGRMNGCGACSME